LGWSGRLAGWPGINRAYVLFAHNWIDKYRVAASKIGEQMEGDFMKKLLLAIICILALSWAGPAGACDPEDFTTLINTNNCSRCNLSGCALAGRDLSGARFYRADLSGANLQKANLAGAILMGANLENANLTGADLSGADLIRAKLSGANLTDAALGNARWVNGNKCGFFSTGECD
jgi:uncharacterized protein YjbI with pentapeptide repeats